MIYLVLAPATTQTVTVNYQSVGREITTVSNLTALESVEENSDVLVFYDFSLDLQKMLDLYYLLDLRFKIIVNNQEDLNLFTGIFSVHLIDYKTIDGALIRAIKLEDEVAMQNLQRSSTDRLSLSFRPSYLLEIDALISAPSSNAQVRTLGQNYKNLHAEFSELADKYIKSQEKIDSLIRDNFSLKQSIKKFSSDMKAFIKYFTGLQNRYRAITALSVIKEGTITTLPQHLTTLYLKDYGIPNVFPLLSALYDSLTTFYKKYVKVIYICEPDGISINTIPSNYKLITSGIQQADLLGFDFLSCVGNVNTPVNFLMSASSFNTLIICDARRVQDPLFKGETLMLNLAPDIHTVQALGLSEEITITPSERSLYTLREETITQNAAYGSRNSKLVGDVINTLLERRGEV